MGGPPGGRKRNRELESLNPHSPPDKHAPGECGPAEQGQATGLAVLNLLLRLAPALFGTFVILCCHPDSPFDAAFVDAARVPPAFKLCFAYYIAHSLLGTATEFKSASGRSVDRVYLTFSTNQRTKLEEGESGLVAVCTEEAIYHSTPPEVREARLRAPETTIVVVTRQLMDEAHATDGWEAEWTSSGAIAFSCLTRFKVDLDSAESVANALAALSAVKPCPVERIFVDPESGKAETCGSYVDLAKILYQLGYPSRFDPNHAITRLLWRYGEQERSMRAIYAVRDVTGLQKVYDLQKWIYGLRCQTTNKQGHVPYDVEAMGVHDVACMGYERDGSLLHISLLRMCQPNVFILPCPSDGPPIKITLEAEKMFSSGNAVNYPYEPGLFWSSGDAKEDSLPTLPDSVPGGSLRTCPYFGVSTMHGLDGVVDGAGSPAALETMRTRLEQLCDPIAELSVCPEAERLCLRYAAVAARQQELLVEDETDQTCSNEYCLETLPAGAAYRKKIAPGKFPPNTPVGRELAAAVSAGRSFFLCNACNCHAAIRRDNCPVGQWRVPPVQCALVGDNKRCGNEDCPAHLQDSDGMIKVAPGKFPRETPVGAAVAAAFDAGRSFFLCNACNTCALGDPRYRPAGQWRVPRQKKKQKK